MHMETRKNQLLERNSFSFQIGDGESAAEWSGAAVPCSVGSQGFQMTLNELSGMWPRREWLHTKNSTEQLGGKQTHTRQGKPTRDVPRMEAARARSSKSMETSGGVDRQQMRCDLAVRKKRWGWGGRRWCVTFYLSAIFRGSISSTLQAVGSSLILPEEDADLKGSLGSKK